MAASWTAHTPNLSFATTTYMMGLMNDSTSRILKLRRIGMVNVQTASVSGVVCKLEIRRMTTDASWTPGGAVAPVPYDTTNVALDSTVCGTKGTPTTSGATNTLKTFVWSSEEAALSGTSIDEMTTHIPLGIVFDPGYGDSETSPLVLRQNEAAFLYNVSGAAGLVDIWMEFTNE